MRVLNQVTVVELEGDKAFTTHIFGRNRGIADSNAHKTAKN